MAKADHLAEMKSSENSIEDISDLLAVCISGSL